MLGREIQSALSLKQADLALSNPQTVISDLAGSNGQNCFVYDSKLVPKLLLTPFVHYGVHRKRLGNDLPEGFQMFEDGLYSEHVQTFQLTLLITADNCVDLDDNDAMAKACGSGYTPVGWDDAGCGKKNCVRALGCSL